MLRRSVRIACLVLGPAAASQPAVAQVDLTCPHRGANPGERQSPLDSVMFRIDGNSVKVCYGRPSARGRTMIGGDAVPLGEIWRTGANETTKIRTTAPLVVAGIEIPAGTYAMYTVPGEESWEVILTRSWEQWGRENYFTDEVRATIVDRATVPHERVDEHIETFTMRTEPGDGGVTLILEWEHSRIRIPIVAG